jgi:hypothetical protein
MQAALYILGALCELLGIVLIAAPDLVPGAVRASRWTRLHWRRIENRIRRLLGLPLRSIVHTVGMADTIEIAGRIAATKSTSALTIDEKVEFLLRRDQEAQRDVNDLRGSVADLEAETSRRLDEFRDELKTYVDNELVASEADYKIARIGGTIALAIGLTLTTIGNFV